MIEQQSRYAVYGSKLKRPGKLTTITNTETKVLSRAYCIKCGAVGMTYQDPNGTIVKPHFCIRHNPKIDRRREKTELNTKVCREPTCGKLFNNNGRNSHSDKDFCSSNCSSKYSNRLARTRRTYNMIGEI